MAVPTINGVSNAIAGQSTGTTLVFTLTTTGAGRICVGFLCNGLTVSSVTASGLTFSVRAAREAGNNMAYWTADSAGAVTALEITVTLSGTNTFSSGVAWGVGTTTGFDVNGSLPDSVGADPGTISTTAAETLVVAICRYSGTPSPTAHADWALIAAPSNGYFGAFYKTYTSAQTSLSVPAGGNGSGGANGQFSDAFAGAASASQAPMYYSRKVFFPV